MITNCTVKEQIVIVNTVFKLLSDKRTLKSQILNDKTTITEFASLVASYQTIDSTLKRQDSLEFLFTRSYLESYDLLPCLL